VRLFIYNHPGSLVALRNTNGTVAESYSYDPWGRRGDMNGRVYDPVTAGFLSPDPFVTNPYFSQSYNSYSYCVNNPLKFCQYSSFVSAPLLQQNYIRFVAGAVASE
jgi:RHS repeat-associated protein